MAQAVAARSASNIATNVASKIGGKLVDKAGEEVFKVGLAMLMGGSDTDKLSKQITDVLDEVKQVRADVQELSNQLANYIIQLRTDTIQGYATNINAAYSGVEDILTDATRLPKDHPDTKKNLESLQKNLETELTTVHNVNQVPAYLDNMHRLLNGTSDSSLIKEVADKVFKESSDIVGYYLAVKAFCMDLWVSTIKGIALLKMAEEMKSVDWVEGPVTIERQVKQLNLQEDSFRELVGRNTCALVESILEGNGDQAIPIQFRSSWGFWIKVLDGDPERSHVQAFQADGANVNKWWLKPRSKNDIGPNKTCPLQLIEERTGAFLFATTLKKSDLRAMLRSDDSPNVWGLKDKEKRESSPGWIIDTAVRGSDAYYIRDATWKNVLVIDPGHDIPDPDPRRPFDTINIEGNQLWMREEGNDFNFANNRTYFEISPWNK